MYTQNEQQIFNHLVDASMSGSIYDLADLVKLTEIPAKKIRGVISSLVKKGKVMVDEVDSIDHIEIHYWPIHSEHGATFWCDCLAEGEEVSELISDEMVKS